MSWSNQNNGGPWKQAPGPWGQKPTPNGSPDFEDMLRRGQDKVKRLLPGGGLSSPAGLGLIVLAAIAVWLATGLYTVQPNEVGINMIFGRYTGKTNPGLRYNLPYPIGAVTVLPVTNRNSIDIGAVTRDDSRRNGGGLQVSLDVPEESLMLTGDENIADVKFRVVWQIDPSRPEDFAFNLRNPQETVKAVAESAMREVIGKKNLTDILTTDRKIIEPAVQDLIQGVLNGYKAGIMVIQVQLLSVDPPDEVIAAYRDVTAAQQDLQRQRNEADAYANRVVPEARGAAARIVQEAEGYKEQAVQEAQGQASRFDQVYAQYKNAPKVTRERMYIETMEQVLGGSNKVITDNKGAGVVPYLPLGALDAKPATGAKP
ncbi:FtsH protease activity modulator HflK [Lichenifustis flavocetrariae]|uniref:Protein HflK n=1 Tax=Lichenifustis flavocetrariae TaxID=2949735 RepID=A0AA41Z739_9HYPH|nr:FtsH protease activity modulator HflK [Lichenifustis flavocetrariae]MCW6510467.1 FtsH protease activity modulator HflK [Lichenifustis flavocetrariae]